MTLSLDYRQMLRAAGLITVACVSGYLPFCTTPASPVLTALLLAAFVGLFWGSTAPRAFDDPSGIFEIVGQSVIALPLTWLHPFFLLASLMVIVSWQAGLRLPARSAAALPVVQTVASALVLMLSLRRPEVLTYVGAALGFQVSDWQPARSPTARPGREPTWVWRWKPWRKGKRAVWSSHGKTNDSKSHGISTTSWATALWPCRSPCRLLTAPGPERRVKPSGPQRPSWPPTCWTACAMWWVRCVSRPQPR